MAATNNAITFDEYFNRMRPMAERISSARSRGHYHPYLSREDLLQEASIALLRVYTKFVGRVPTDDMCRLGTRYIMFKMFSAYAKAGRGGQEVRSRKDEPARVISLDAVPIKLPVDGRALEQMLARGIIEEIGRMEARGAFQTAEPSGEVLAALCKILEADIDGAREAYIKIRHGFKRNFGYTSVTADRNATLRGGRDMAEGPEAPDNMEAAMPEKKNGGKAKASKAKAEKKPKVKAKAEKKPKVKAKAEKKPKEPRPTAVYIGGGRSAPYKEGEVLEVLGVLYRVQDAKGRKCFLAPKYLKLKAK